ncbi:MAG: hypothetical protein ACQGVK_20495 [Myxococcota bacterium]
MDDLWPGGLGTSATLLLLVQLGLALGYASRVRRARVRVPRADVLFAVAFAAGWIAVVSPGSFRPLARAALASSGVPAVLVEADARLASVEAIPPDLWNELRERVGWPFEGESPMGPIPLRGGRTLQERALPALEAWVVGWMRTSTWLGATGALLFAYVWRRWASRGSRLRDLEERVEALEAELDALADESEESAVV